ncbi:MAG: transposase, partial [Thermus sp.]
GAYLFVLKANQGEVLEWALEVFKGVEGRRLPGCRQAVRVEREVAGARRLGELLLSRWEVENRFFWVRDVLFHEDACQVRGVGARVLAALRAFLVSLLHRRGVREKKAALEAFSFHPLSALRFLGLYAA